MKFLFLLQDEKLLFRLKKFPDKIFLSNEIINVLIKFNMTRIFPVNSSLFLQYCTAMKKLYIFYSGFFHDLMKSN